MLVAFPKLMLHDALSYKVHELNILATVDEDNKNKQEDDKVEEVIEYESIVAESILNEDKNDVIAIKLWHYVK